MRIGHISSTQMRMFAGCQAAWMFRYVWDMTVPPKAAMMRGSCIHKGIAHNYLQKIESREDVPVDEVLDVYGTTFDEEAHVTAWASEDQGEVKDSGIRVLKHYQEVKAPVTQPVDVEKRFSMNLSWTDGEEPKQMEFQGVIDLATDKNELVDHKSTGRTPNEPSNDDCNQLAGYYLGQEAMGQSPDKARLDYLMTLKTPKIVSFDVPITDGKKKFILKQIPRIVKSMESENYFANRSHIYCSETGCGYWNICHEEFGG